MLTRWEYYSIVQIKKALKRDEDKEESSNEGGRKKNKQFQFSDGIEISTAFL